MFFSQRDKNSSSCNNLGARMVVNICLFSRRGMKWKDRERRTLSPPLPAPSLHLKQRNRNELWSWALRVREGRRRGNVIKSWTDNHIKCLQTPGPWYYLIRLIGKKWKFPSYYTHFHFVFLTQLGHQGVTPFCFLQANMSLDFPSSNWSMVTSQPSHPLVSN